MQGYSGPIRKLSCARRLDFRNHSTQSPPPIIGAHVTDGSSAVSSTSAKLIVGEKDYPTPDLSSWTSPMMVGSRHVETCPSSPEPALACSGTDVTVERSVLSGK